MFALQSLLNHERADNRPKVVSIVATEPDESYWTLVHGSSGRVDPWYTLADVGMVTVNDTAKRGAVGFLFQLRPGDGIDGTRCQIKGCRGGVDGKRSHRRTRSYVFPHFLTYAKWISTDQMDRERRDVVLRAPQCLPPRSGAVSADLPYSALTSS